MEESFIKSFDEQEIFVYAWKDVENPKGIVQIFHGMAEHAKRYEEFAKFLNKNGYLVFADDHRAHGKTAKGIENVGKYNLSSNLFYDTLLDEVYLSKMLSQEYPSLPIYAFGHSYGSILAQAYIQKSIYYKKAIICGSALMKNRLDVKFAKLIAKTTSLFKGKDAPAKMIAKLSFGVYDKKVKKGSWLNTIEKEVEKYNKDEFCGGIMSAKFYQDFFQTFNWLYKKQNISKISKTKPIFLISGKCDAFGNMGKSVQALYDFYKKNDLDVKLKLYDNARHEILNESIKKDVYKDILNFIEE